MANGDAGGRGPGFYVIVVLALLLLAIFILFMVGAFNRAPPETQSPDIPVRLDTPVTPGTM